MRVVEEAMEGWECINAQEGNGNALKKEEHTLQIPLKANSVSIRCVGSPVRCAQYV